VINKIHFDTATISQRQSQQLFSMIQEEASTIGYYRLPDQNIEKIVQYAGTIGEEIEHIIVIGIGGSSLGAKAIYSFLKPMQVPLRKLHFFESTDPLNIAEQVAKIDREKSHFLVISKSGTTIETMALFKYFYAMDDTPSHYTFITDRGSPLEQLAQEMGSQCCYLADGVGGRFSVLSVVGLLPLVLCGIDVAGLLSGAKKVKESFFNDGYLQQSLINKSIFYAKHHMQYNINCLFAYSETLRYFTEWYVQLWGESLGKKQCHSAFHVGMTPIGLIGPKDQHSFLQLIMEGTRDKSITFIKIKDFQNELTIPHTPLPHLKSLDILDGVTFHDLITMQSDAIIQALLDQEDIPLDEIVIERVDAQSMGALIYYYELLTSLVGRLIDVNTYDQPGVEIGKIILKQKLKGKRND